MNEKIHCCDLCLYSTNKIYNLNRHKANKHIETEEQQSSLITDQETTSNYCNYCFKYYNNKYYLQKHKNICNGCFDNLTCFNCFQTFSNRQSKCNHKKRNNCEHRSIIYSKNDNIKLINNYGDERTDYLTNEVMLNILKKVNCIETMIKEKHFNPNFPENQNIKPCKDKDSKCYIMKDNTWYIIDKTYIAEDLLKKNADKLTEFSYTNKEEIENELKNQEIYEFICNRLKEIKYRVNKKEYKNILIFIKSLIENDSNK